ncbi:nuclear transport factor 2 family protein [Demequina sp. SYSU T00192]|uniref:Nuclear transport factor 2 family protein n=1 Tax=Demequina litoralis TaxID=3051660 RepID=A0ABT8GB07_9MICO|nr:nuclear transport factor 2 family protein [Demequina sp. SYSU T00192]MDN4476324.1 nuclear transport factor 2 family protein [Demequina sp. SYSU T00192]
MTDVTLADPATREALLALEERRRRALIDVDLDALDDLYDDALVHIHAPGLVHTKEMLVEHTRTRRPYLDMSRGDLEIRVLGDVAIMTGLLTNHLRNPDGTSRTMSGQVTQVVRRCPDGAWRYLSFQMTPLTEQVWGALPSEKKD